MCIRDRLYSLPSRDLIADSVEYMVNAHCADAMAVSYTHLDVYKRQKQYDALEPGLIELRRVAREIVDAGENHRPRQGRIRRTTPEFAVDEVARRQRLQH